MEKHRVQVAGLVLLYGDFMVGAPTASGVARNGLNAFACWGRWSAWYGEREKGSVEVLAGRYRLTVSNGPAYKTGHEGHHSCI
jgi:hypothetical protein